MEIGRERVSSRRRRLVRTYPGIVPDRTGKEGTGFGDRIDRYDLTLAVQEAYRPRRTKPHISGGFDLRSHLEPTVARAGPQGDNFTVVFLGSLHFQVNRGADHGRDNTRCCSLV